MTDKQLRFIEEYLIDLNAAQAAIRAGYSPKTAKDIGAQNLAKLNIRSRIDQAMAERSKRTGINQDRIVEELAKVALINPAEVIDLKKGTVREEAKSEDLAAIAGIKVKDSFSDKGDMTEREIRFHDKLKALELLGKHLGMFKDKVDIKVDLPVVISGEADLEE